TMSGGRPVPPLEFTSGEGSIKWSAAPAIVADEDVAAATRGGRGGAAAMTGLRNLLAAGARPALEVAELAREAGLSRTLLRRVKMEIGVRSEKRECRGPSYWTLPGADDSGADDREFDAEFE